MLHKCKIIDTTLREGEQTPEVLFTLDEKKQILDQLVAIGIDEVELGISSSLSVCLEELLLFCAEHHPKLSTSLWSRCQENDISYGCSLKPDIISLSLPASDLHLYEKLGKSRQWAEECLKDSIDLVRSFGVQVAVGFEDATRSDPEFLVKLATLAEQSGAIRIRIADTIGHCSPAQIQQLVTMLISNLAHCEVGVHTHNDFGMATANAIAAYEAGATWVDATILGLGERCGCTRLEEVIGYLSLIADHEHYCTEKLSNLSHYVAACTSKKIDDHRPIIGAKIFNCETGLHLQGIQNNPTTYEPYDPEKVGLKRKLFFGAKSGKRALGTLMRQQGITLSEDALSSHLDAIRQLGQQQRRPLSEEELQATFLPLSHNQPTN